MKKGSQPNYRTCI